MTSTLRRAAAFAAVGSLALAAPTLGVAAAAPFVAAAVVALLVGGGPLFELFAHPTDRHVGRLYGLAGFALAATVLALLATVPTERLPLTVFVASVLVLAYGNLGRRAVAQVTDAEFAGVTGFAVAGFAAALTGQVVVALQTGASPALAQFGFIAAAGALLAALLRSVLYDRDDPLVILAVGLLLWLFEAIGVSVTPTGLAVALGVTVVLGYASYALETASIPGMLTGVLLGLLSLVLGGPGWFVVLVSFFAVGGLATRYRYEEKRRRGIAQENEGARGSGNVLANSVVALLALIGFAASATLPADPALFRLAFAGSVAAAMSDTLSSEIGGLFDDTRLITTLKPVAPGTDGGVTLEGEVVGIAGAALVGALAFAVLPVGVVGVVAVVVGGFVGMTVDSLLGATLEGQRVGNQAVNFLATLSAALASVIVAVLASGLA